MVDQRPPQPQQQHTSSGTGSRRRQRHMSALWVAAALVAATLPPSAHAAAQLPGTAMAPQMLPAAADNAQFVLQSSATSNATSTNIEIMQMRDSPPKSMGTIQTLETAATVWKLTSWDTSLAALEPQLQAVVPALTQLQLHVSFQPPQFSGSSVEALAFEHSTAQWRYGPALVLTENALSGFDKLQSLSFVRFDVTIDDNTWLAPTATLQQLAFELCTVPSFAVAPTVKITEAIFRGSNLTSFPKLLLTLETPLTTLILENNQIKQPVMLTSIELAALQRIPNITFNNNKFVRNWTSTNASSKATTATNEAYGPMPVATTANAATSAADSSCDKPTEYKNIPICVSDLTFRRIDPTKIGDNDGSNIGRAPPQDTAGPVGGTSDSSATSSKLTTSMIAILSIGGVVIVAIASVLYRRHYHNHHKHPTGSSHTKATSDNTRASFYEHSDVLLSPTKLDTSSPTATGTTAMLADASSTAASKHPRRKNDNALSIANNAVRHQTSTTLSVVADLDLGRDVIHLGRKLGVHGLRKGAFRDVSVVAMRLSLRSLHISMREVNRIVASYVPFRHRNIVTLVGTSMTALDDLLIVVEYMAHGSLRSVVRNPKIDLPWHDRVRMSSDICGALAFVHTTTTATTTHRSTTMHQHLTAKSVLVSRDLVCKLDVLDYGRNVRDFSVPVLNYGECAIATRAPEVLAGGHAMARPAQVYALGAILCELSLRHVPFHAILEEMGTTLGELFIAAEVQAQRLTLEPSTDAPVAFQELVMRCVAFDPAVRPSVLEVADALHAISRSL